MAKIRARSDVTIGDIDEDQEWLISDFQLILKNFLQFGIQSDKPESSTHDFASELALRDLEMLVNIASLAPVGDDEVKARWRLKVYRAMQKGHQGWVKHLSLP